MIILGERKMQQVCLEQMHCKRWWVHSCKRNRIGGIFVLHWASWADYIGYIGLTPHVGRQCSTIPVYSNNSVCLLKIFLYTLRWLGLQRAQ